MPNIGHIASKRQQKRDRKKSGVAKKRTSGKLRKVKAPSVLPVKRNKSQTFDAVLSTGRLTGRANSFLKSPGVVGTKVKRKAWWAGNPQPDGKGAFVSRTYSSKLG